MNHSEILVTSAGPDYELLDSGDNMKLERFGDVILSRPDPQALWQQNSPTEWKRANGSFARTDGKGSWSLQAGLSDRWSITHGGFKFWIKPTPFKHVGLFPEQAQNWQWIAEQVELAIKSGLTNGADQPEILNLFGYSGGATLACAQAGAKVVHVDGSKSALAWARENAELSGLDKKPIRWILDDAREFVRREIKRGRHYDGIIMDPPAFGHGPNNELWKIEEDFLPFLDDCLKLLNDKPTFFLINGYSAGYSAIAYSNNLMRLKERYGGSVSMGELAIRESGTTGRLLPCGIFARWSAR